MGAVPEVSLDRLLADYDRFLLDAYGVLVDDQGPLPGAVAFVSELLRRDKRCLVLTNSASRLPEGIAADLQNQGFPLEVEHILTSGMLLPGYFAQNALVNAPCLVLGTEDSNHYVERAGGRVLPHTEFLQADVLVIADQAGFDCLDAMNRGLNLLLQRCDNGEDLALVLCNPDLIYPVATDRFGFTAGGLAAMMETLLRERYPARETGFVRLGKPHAPIFDEALRRIGADRGVMLGDQLATDILGAQRAGIASVWVRTGLGAGPAEQAAIRPTWQLPDLTGRSMG
jgi:HAD superfamily hydrolase (TIGR01450 family)